MHCSPQKAAAGAMIMPTRNKPSALVQDGWRELEAGDGRQQRTPEGLPGFGYGGTTRRVK